MDFIETLKGLYNTVIDGVKIRVVNPLASGFLFAWIVFNWKGLYFFFAESGTVDHKLNKIEALYSDPALYLYYPLSTAIAYIVFFPLLTQASTAVWTIMEKWGASLANKVIPELSPITRAEKAALIKMVNTKNTELIAKLKEKEDQIEALTSLVKQDQSSIKPVEPDTSDNNLSQALDEMEGRDIKRKIAAVDASENHSKETDTSQYPVNKISKSTSSDLDYSYFKTAKGKQDLHEAISKEMNLSRGDYEGEEIIRIATTVIGRVVFPVEKDTSSFHLISSIHFNNESWSMSKIQNMMKQLEDYEILHRIDERYSLSHYGKSFLAKIINAQGAS